MLPSTLSKSASARPDARVEFSHEFRCALVKGLAAASVMSMLPLAADASPTGRSIAIKFGTEQPVAGTTVDGAAGVLNTVRWNNFSGPTQATPQTLTIDLNSGSLASTATVVWSSNNTWSSTGLGEENNTAPAGDNRDLMAGYLDTTDVTVTTVNVTGLNSAGFNLGYDVYVYIQGGVNGRGGDYTIGTTTIHHDTSAAFNGTFQQDTTPTGLDTDGSNYIVFRNVTGNAFQISATPTVGAPFRAPLNAIEIVAAIPEPTTGLSALGGGTALLLGMRRRRAA
jgi:hypothetical protein